MYQSKQVAARKPLPEPTSAVNPVEVYGEIVVPAGGFPANSIIEMVGIPAYCIPTGWKLVCDSLDSGATPAIKLTVGKLSGLYGSNDDARTFTADWLATQNNVGQTGGIVINPLAAPLLYVPNTADVGIGIKINVAAATPVVGARLRLFVSCIPADTLLS
jgi:hypothetical protein